MNLPNDKHQAYCVIKALSITIVKFVREVWLIWNKHIHNPQPTGVTTFKQQQILADIRHLYFLRRRIQETDKNLLPPQYLERVISKQNKSLELFNKQNKEKIRKSTQEMKVNQIKDHPVPAFVPQHYSHQNQTHNQTTVRKANWLCLFLYSPLGEVSFVGKIVQWLVWDLSLTC